MDSHNEILKVILQESLMISNTLTECTLLIFCKLVLKNYWRCWGLKTTTLDIDFQSGAFDYWATP